MNLRGKGFYLWNIPNCEKGNVQAIAEEAQKAGLTHVLIKIADRFYPHNVSKDGKEDYVPPLVEALHARGIQAWGWQYIYGFEPIPEAQIASRRLSQLHLDGFVIDAEEQYKLPGRKIAAQKYLGELRSRFPDLPLGFSSYRFPKLHASLPWEVFLSQVQVIMPQVYWEQAHNPAAQLRRCLMEYRNLQPAAPIIPTGAAYKWGGWRPTPQDIQEFLQAVEENELPGCNFWGWEFCRRDLPELWEVIAHHHRAPAPQPEPPSKDIIEALFEALNQQDIHRLLLLYHPAAVHVKALRTDQGHPAIERWYKYFLNDLLPQARYTLTSLHSQGNLRFFKWKASSPRGEVQEGTDTVHLFNDRILYHASNFQITRPTVSVAAEAQALHPS